MIIRAYFQTLVNILTQPTRFFRGAALEGGIARPLAFALVTHWIGSAISFLWNALMGSALQSYLSQFVDIVSQVADVDAPGRGVDLTAARDRVMAWFWNAGPVVIDPFLTLISLLFTSFFVFVGARLLVTPGKNGAPKVIDYETALRIVCYSAAGSIFYAIPLLGPLLSLLMVSLLAIAGAREIYRISTLRALFVGLFPKVLFIGFFGSIFFFGLVFVFKWITSGF